MILVISMEYIELDGSMLEGGGGLVRTAVAMSALTKKPVKIFNIRAKRPNPGLKSQHLTAIKCVAALCNAKVIGLKLNSTQIEFIPGDEILGKKLRVDVGTAGSITLVLQALTLPAIFASSEVNLEIKGGTDVPFSCPVDYYKNVLIPLFQKFGVRMELEVVRRGFYPRGGGLVRVKYKPMKFSEVRKVNLVDRGTLLRIDGISFASRDLERAKVAERQALAAKKILISKFNKDVRIWTEYKTTSSPGSGIVVWAKYSNTILGGDSLGEKGKVSEKVGREAAEKLLREVERDACVDSHAADNLIPFMSLSPGSSIKTSEISLHTRTNIWVCEKFMGGKFKIEGSTIHYS